MKLYRIVSIAMAWGARVCIVLWMIRYVLAGYLFECQMVSTLLGWLDSKGLTNQLFTTVAVFSVVLILWLDILIPKMIQRRGSQKQMKE